jgi:hypothetical protein
MQFYASNVKAHGLNVITHGLNVIAYEKRGDPSWKLSL